MEFETMKDLENLFSGSEKLAEEDRRDMQVMQVGDIVAIEGKGNLKHHTIYNYARNACGIKIKIRNPMGNLFILKRVG